MRKYNTLCVTPELRAAIDELCEHKTFITDICPSAESVEIGCYKCSAIGRGRVLPKSGFVCWGEGVPSVTLIRIKVFTTSVDEESPLDGVIGDSAGVFYKSNRFQDQAAGALRGLSYAKIEEATEETPDVRDLRKNLEAWLEAVEGLDLTAGFDAALEVLCAIPRWEELCYLRNGDAHRSAIDLSEVGYGFRDLRYYLSYLDVAEFQDAYGAVTHPALTWLNYVEDDGPNYQGMETPSRQVMELCLAAAADCVRRTLRMGRQPEWYIEQVEKEIRDLVEVLREALQKGDDVAETQGLLDGYHVEERSNQDTSFYVVLKADEFKNPEGAADEYQAWSRGEVSDYRLETCKVYTPSEFADIEGDARAGDWEHDWDAEDLNDTWYGCGGLQRYVQPIAEKYAEETGAHFIGFDFHD